MTTSSSRRLLRGTCLALVLGGAVAFGSSVSPRPFGYDSWPKPPAPARVQPLVQVRPVPSPGDQDVPARRVRSSTPSAPSRVAADARPRSGETPGSAPIRPRRGRSTAAPAGAGDGAAKPSKDRGHGHPASGAPAADQPDASHQEPEQAPDPAPSPDPIAPVRVAQAAPAHENAKQGRAIGLSLRAHGPKGRGSSSPASRAHCSEPEQDGARFEQDDD